MQSLHERVAYLEGRVTDTATMAGELRQDLRNMRAEIRQDVSDLRAEIVGLRTNIEAMDQKVDRHFIVMIGAQLTTLLAIIGALLTPYFRSG